MSGVLAAVPALAATGTITGVVTISGTSTAIAGVTVATSPATTTATTDSAGAYSLTVTAGSTYDVLFTNPGYNDNFVGAVIAPGTASQSLVPIPAQAAMDLFSRPDQVNNLGTASDGHSWTRDNLIVGTNPAPTADIVGRQTFFKTVAANTDLNAWMGFAYRDQEVTADIQAVAVLTPTAPHGGRLLARVQSAENWIVLTLNPGPDTLTIWTDAGGCPSCWAQIGSAHVPFALNTTYHAKLDVIGTVAYGKAWTVGTTEPGWQLIASGIPQALMSTGVGGLRTGGADAYFSNFMQTPITQISGNVTDAGTALAIAGATVSLNTGPSTVTDANGNYLLSNVPAGTYTVSASAPAHNPASMNNVSVSTGVSAFATNFALTAIPPPVWTSLGGLLTTSPGASSSSASRSDSFVRGTDNGLWQVTRNGTAWGGWQSLGGLLTSRAAAIASNAGRIDAFVRGSDNALYQETWNGTSWSTWQRLGGILTSGPAADYRAGTPGSIDMFVRGTDNGLWHRWSDDGGNTWGNWESLGGGLTSDPGAVAWSSSGVHVVVRGTDNGVWIRSWNASTGWNSWATLGGIATTAPDVTSCSSGHLDVFVRGTDNGLWQLGFNGTSWTGWKSLGGSWTSAPSAVCRPGSTTIDLFARGTDNALWTTQVQGS